MAVTKKNCAAFLSILFVFLFQHPGITQHYLLSSLPVEKELSSRQITCFFQDSKGFMWIGTEDGLNFYNANSIKIFKHDVKNKNSLLNSYIQNICEDNKGNIWVASANGVDLFDPSGNIFHHYLEDAEKRSFGFKPRVYADRKGNMWIGGDALFKFDVTSRQFKRIINPYSGILNTKYANTINGFYQDSKYRYWVSTSDGLFLYDDIKNVFTRFDIPPINDNYKRFGILFMSVYEDKKGDLWVGTWGDGVYKILVAEKKLLPVEQKSVTLTYSAQKLKDEDLFWYSNNGLIGYNERNKTHISLFHRNDDPFSLRNDNISVLFTDKQDQLWIGYEKQGIQILSPGNQLIRSYTISSNTDKIKISSVSAIAIKDSSIYLGGWYNAALCKLNNEFKPVRWWSSLPADKTNSSSNVSDIYFDKQGNAWLTTFNGLIWMNSKTGEIKNYTDNNTKNNNRFLKILPEGDSVLWISGFGNGLSRFSLTTHLLQVYNNKQILWKIVFDKNNNIWCANNDGYLERFDTRNKTFSTLHFDTLTERSIYFDLAYDSVSNSMWVASTNGLLKIDTRSLIANLFTEKDGLPTTRISLLTWDNKHRLWIGTNHGLSLYDLQKKTFRNFYLNNGLSTEKLDYCLSAQSNGKLYIGADNSIMVMDIENIEEQNETPAVYIMGIAENGFPVNSKNKQVIDLPYYRNNLSFEFAIPDFINSEDNQLLYKLDGWDPDFIQTKKGSVNYNKLPPDKYVFTVKAIDHNGIKNDVGDNITIIIRSPFWNTWWFISLVGFVMIAFLVLVIRYISQRNLKEKLLRLEKEQAVEKERNRISHDMHDDLGSGLTKIAILSEVVKKQINEPEKAKEQLDKISESSRELVDNLQDIIWVLNPKNDTLENLAAYIREYSLKFFESSSIDLQFNFPDQFSLLKLSEETRRNIFLTIKETLNNIAKHSKCKKVIVSIEERTRNILLQIKDNGQGFDIKNKRQFGNGLINMQTRIEQIGGTYTLHSEPGKGTTTIIEIPV